MTPAEQALVAIRNVLDRACADDRRRQSGPEDEDERPRDPGLGYYLCPLTDSWERLVAAEAALLGKDPTEHERYRQDCYNGYGDPEAPYRGLDEPAAHHWVEVLGHRWATDGYLILREDAPRPPKVRGRSWLSSSRVPRSILVELIFTRDRGADETPAAWQAPTGDGEKRLAPMREGTLELWGPPVHFGEQLAPMLAFFREGEALPIAISTPEPREGV